MPLAIVTSFVPVLPLAHIAKTDKPISWVKLNNPFKAAPTSVEAAFVRIRHIDITLTIPIRHSPHPYLLQVHCIGATYLIRLIEDGVRM
jgi:hypothetical protein